MFDTLKLYAVAGLLALLVGMGIYASHLSGRVDTLKQTVSALEQTNRGLTDALKAVEAVHATRTETAKELEGVKQQINETTEAPLPSPIAAALDGLRKHRQQDHRTGQPSDVPREPAGSP